MRFDAQGISQGYWRVLMLRLLLCFASSQVARKNKRTATSVLLRRMPPRFAGSQWGKTAR